jgi:uncharacterized protein involved in type VI secretion and phage assembly
VTVELDLIGLLTGDADAPSNGSDDGRPRASGVIPAVITNVSDRKNLGRVKVRFAFTGRVESRWARVAAPWAGAKRGAYFVPEVDDEVLVAFRDGNVKDPYVLGFLWSDTSVPPPEPGPKPRRSAVRSRTGHRVVFDEGDGQESVVIESAKGHRVVLSDHAKASDIELHVAGGRASVKLDADGGTATVTVNDSGTISLDAPRGKVTINAASIELTATGTISLDGQTVSVTGHELVKINA